MPKLPAANLAKLKTAFASNHFPDDGPDADFLYDFVSELHYSTAEDAFEPGPRSARRDVSILLNIWDSIPCDGMITGVFMNQAELVPEAIAIASELGLREQAKLLQQGLALFPAHLVDGHDIHARLEWFRSPEGESVSDEIDQLGDTLEEWEHRGPVYEACLRRVLAEPAQFFDA